MEITYRDYLDAVKSGNVEEYIKGKFGEAEANFHLYRRKPEDLSYGFKVVRDYEKDLTWGQFIAIENLLMRGSKDEILDKLPCLIIRGENEDIFSNDDPNYEKALCYTIKDLPAGDVINEISNFYDLREAFLSKKYNGVFYKEKEEENEDKEEEKKDKKPDPYEQFSSQWYWYVLTRELAIDNIVITQDVSKSKIENALDTRLGLVAPEIAFKRQKGMLEEFEEKKMKMRNDFS